MSVSRGGQIESHVHNKFNTKKNIISVYFVDKIDFFTPLNFEIENCSNLYFFRGAINYSKKPGLFKEQNTGFSAQIHSVTLTKTWFKKRHVSKNYN